MATRSVSRKRRNGSPPAKVKTPENEFDVVREISGLVAAINDVLGSGVGVFPDGLAQLSFSFRLANGTAAEVSLSGRSGGLPAPSGYESCRDGSYRTRGDDLSPGEKVPAKSEVEACGAITKPILRTDPEFKQLLKNTNANIEFKDEEGTGDDRMMSAKLKASLDALATKVSAEWDGVKLRVTEAWDEDGPPHTGKSLHFEGRAADLTTSPVDSAKLGRLARLAVDAGLGWVWYEDAKHIHVSVKK